MFPSRDIIMNSFAFQHPVNQHKEHKQPLRSEAPVSTNRQLFPAWSAVDDAKKRSNAIAAEAAREFDVASKMAQEKTGKIEPWTPKYYAACTVGGMLACVGLLHLDCHDGYLHRHRA